MAKDYARRATDKQARNKQPRNIKAIVAWVSVLAVILIVAFWVFETWQQKLADRSHLPPVYNAQAVGDEHEENPYQSQSAHEPVVTSAPVAPEVPGAKLAEDATNKIHFEFYSTLPKMQVEHAAADQQATNQQSVPAGQSQPAKHQPGYWLQLGAYYTMDSAEAFQSRIELLGLDTVIDKTPPSSPSGRTIYRVQLGPYASYDEAKKKQQEIKQMKLDSLIKKES